METFICSLLFTSVIFFNFVQSNPMKKWEASDLRAEIEPAIPGLPKPRLLTQEGRPVGVYYNGKVYPVKDQPEPDPAPEPPSPPSRFPPSGYLPPPPRPQHMRRPPSRHFLEFLRESARFLQPDIELSFSGNLDFPENCELKRDGVTIGRSRNGWMLNRHGRFITRFNSGDLLYYQENILALYLGMRFELVDEDLHIIPY